MRGKLDQDAGKVKIESDLACLTSAEARNTLRTRPSRFRVGPKRHLAHASAPLLDSLHST